MFSSEVIFLSDIPQEFNIQMADSNIGKHEVHCAEYFKKLSLSKWTTLKSCDYIFDIEYG